jgi:hypothetical protein
MVVAKTRLTVERGESEGEGKDGCRDDGYFIAPISDHRMEEQWLRSNECDKHGERRSCFLSCLLLLVQLVVELEMDLRLIEHRQIWTCH